MVLDPRLIELKTSLPAASTKDKSGFKSLVIGVGTVTSTTSQLGIASVTEVVMCHLSAPGWGMILSTSGSPVGFSPRRFMSTVLGKISTPQTVKPAS